MQHPISTARAILLLLAGLLASLLAPPFPVAAGEEGEGGKKGGLTLPGLDALGWELHGYMRSRFYHVADLPIDIASSRKEYTSDLDYVDMRLKLAPTIKYGDLVKLTVWFHVLDDVVWGDNAGISTTGVTAAESSLTDREGNEVPPVRIKAAWVELNLKAAVLKFGRQPSDWGLGYLTAGSDGLDDDFSWNRGGSVYDRFMIATAPVTLGLALAKRKETFPLYFAYCYDQLVEDDIAIGRTRLSYSSQWLGDTADDVQSHNFIAFFNGSPVRLLTPDDRLVAGVYYVQRTQRSTWSKLKILDGFLKLRIGPPHLRWFLEGEGYLVRGTTMAVPLGGHPDAGWLAEHGFAASPDYLYQKKEMRVGAYVLRTGGSWRPLPWLEVQLKLETGLGSGDGNPTDGVYKGMAGHPDMKVGLILYDLFFYEMTRQHWTDNPGMWSKGGVYNSYYFTQTVRLTFHDTIDVILLALQAWPDEVDGAVIQKDAMIGNEFDVAVKARLYRGHALVGLEGGFFKPAGAFKMPGVLPDYLWTVQLSTAFVL